MCFISGCNQAQPEPEELLRPVRSIIVNAPESGWVKEFPATVDAVQKARLSFRVAGKLRDILVREGEFVNEGDEIARLDQVDFDIQLTDRQASYEVAKADYDRARKLIEKGAIARAELDNLKAKVSTASSQLQAAQQELDYTILRAPFNGRVARRYIDNYEEVSAKQEIISLQDTSALLVAMELPESVLVRSRNHKDDYTFHARFSSIPGRLFPLTLRETSTQADESTQTYTMTFVMPAIDNHLVLPGMSVVVRAEQKSPRSDIILIPAYAVMEDKHGRFVYVVNDEGDETGRIARQTVTTGQLSKQGMIVESGLVIGDRVVTAGMSQMSEGMRVRLQEGAAR
ncbi:efflux RND transporter periplasmic adaptor subunit [Endozoicomonas sp. SCSIO W0465]|uniref:efflux RND transporter periplasmic adaptor subunit n=1 Tax=Endozoicomonas sp. SCSIO W0465 TaxID=2918516 RepID=UPI002074C0AB|nr:efflux RND transporter periplasmic adaptor subunit [Endozoicomonas sp. SCSIO W0465]USE38445.1 efflux RND transporter periplasmic adaptor subunit [Endozoicomonas sp. SCSIO W0465]